MLCPTAAVPSSEKKVLPSGDSLRVMEVEIAAKMMLTQLRQLQ